MDFSVHDDVVSECSFHEETRQTGAAVGGFDDGAIEIDPGVAHESVPRVPDHVVVAVDNDKALLFGSVFDGESGALCFSETLESRHDLRIALPEEIRTVVDIGRMGA